MARKAVQGYTEKSFYDNTKYSGIVATNDPLNEGYFKHLVNLDISDTGMSVTPRKGFLTTTLCEIDANGEPVPITLSKDTVIFKDDNVQQYIIYDFRLNKGYLVDINMYNTVDKLIPITKEIDAIDWTDVVNYLIREEESVCSLYNQMLSRYDSDPQAAYEETLFNIRRELKLYSSLEKIVDSNMISKAVIKISITVLDETGEPVTPIFMIELYYRDKSTEDFTGNTLILSAVNMSQHPSYIPTERNLASYKSIIPSPMQNLYTKNTRPDSHISTVGPFLYFSTLAKEYVVQHTYKNVDYHITPHFDLSPAYIALNNEENDDDAWAYRFDIISTKDYTKEELVYKETICRGRWMTYKGPDVRPVPVFLNTARDINDAYNPNINLRHYYDTTIIITLVPLTTNGLTSRTRVLDWDDPGFEEYLPSAEDLPINEYDNAIELYNTWISKINLNYNINALQKVINSLSNYALFYVYDLRTAEKTDNFINGTFESTNKVGNKAVMHKTTETETSYANRFKTAEDVIKMINNGTFKNANVTFRYLPYVCNYVTKIYYADGQQFHYSDYRWQFEDLEWKDAELYKGSNQFYNNYNYSNDYYFYRFINGKYEIGASTRELIDYAPDLVKENFFNKGYSLIFYMRPYSPSELEGKDVHELNELQEMWDLTTPYKSFANMSYGYDSLTVTYIPLFLTKEPNDIRLSKNYIVFDKSRIVTWYSNTLYISEPNDYYYFKEVSKKEFGERIVKVLQFKNILLVFTVQHLYAVYEAEVQNSATDAEGKEIITKEKMWASQIVLYNIMTSDKYADVIQVFNQMVLFYSEDGQLFMIKPSTTIDSETRFTLQYFNKSANDILLNYDTYINERLVQYNVDAHITKDQVSIKALVSINFIKIFYCVPGYITYVLIFDVINNRYTVYDTLTFTDIQNKLFIEGGELYLTTQDDKTYLTMPYFEMFNRSNMVDMSVANNFKRCAINALIDTGNLNLNNHLNKRYMDLYVVFKNLSASKLMMYAETVLDDVVMNPLYSSHLQVQDIGGSMYLVPIEKSDKEVILEFIESNNVVDTNVNRTIHILDKPFEENNLLMDFTDYTSNKLITHKSSIRGISKVFRLKMQFISRGAYKIQAFGIVYKERRL